MAKAASAQMCEMTLYCGGIVEDGYCNECGRAPRKVAVGVSPPVNVADTPRADTSSVDMPSVDTPSVDMPSVDTPSVDMPSVDMPSVDMPSVDMPSTDTPRADTPRADSFSFDMQGADTPSADLPGADMPGIDFTGVSAVGSGPVRTRTTSSGSTRTSFTRTGGSHRSGSTRAGSTRTGSTRTGSTRTGSGRSSARHKIGSGLVSVPPIERRDPSMAILDIPKVPEDKRYCSSCGDPVGRTRTGKPGRPEGFCPSCGQRYSFAPKLQAGDLIADQYQVTGCLAHGGLGWIYLATDRNVSDRWVVLKGLLDSGDSAVAAAAAAVAEQRFLAEVEHPNIVKIFNFVEHDGADYIVMEYVGGASLKDMLKQRRAAAGGVADPLPLAQAIAYMLEILPAFSYMHEHDLLLCDFKPDNVIQTPEQLKLIDLGAVLRSGEDSADVYGTVGFQAPEISAEGPSVESDLYTVARSLAVLSTDFRGYQSTFAHSLPDRADVDCYTQFESYYRLLVKATATDPAERFHSADDMAEQLLGVLREVLAADGDLHPAPSRLFTAELRAELATADWRALPLPLLDLEDPAAAFLGTLTVTDPAQLIGLLDKAPQRTPEVDWRAVRTLIDIATGSSAPSYGHVHNRLAEIVELYGVNWRTSWYNGVLALAEGRYDDAVHCFDDVLSQLPGELAPKLALAMAAELNGDYGRAAGYYDTVSATDPAYTNACAGLARCRALAGDRSAAVAAYSRIPDTSSAYGASQIGAVRALVAPGSAIVELEQAEQLLADLPASALEVAGLRAKLFEQVLVAITASETLPPSLFGDQPLTGEEAEHYVRLQLETCYRTQGRAAERAEKIRLVDAANAVRPRTLT